MQYIGGKQKSGGQHIAAIIKRFAQELGTNIVDERMCGMLSVTSRLGPLHVLAADACEPLITMHIAIRDGWDPPEIVTRETWERYKLSPDPKDPMTAFCGFGCSRSGAWFSSFVESFKRTGNNFVPAATAARDSIKRKISKCTNTEFIARDYRFSEPVGVVYCDKPYAESIGYPAVGEFDHDEFWRWAENASRKVPVLVSERSAPDGWIVLWEKSIQSRITTNTGSRRIERLFAHESWKPRDEN